MKLDLSILQRIANIEDLYVPRNFPYGFDKYWKGVFNSDLVFCWFASWNSFWTLILAKLLRKPSILVIGGYDIANLPEADYGHQRGGISKVISRWAMNLATKLIPFSKYSQFEALHNAGISDKRMHVIYIGVPDPFHGTLEIPKSRMALSVGKVDWPNLKRKGLESFVRSAAFLPDVPFVLVGAWADSSIDYLRSIATSNVIFPGRVGEPELQQYFLQAMVYVQASLHEGFGLSVAEAMLAGCIPVVTRAGALPEVVGEIGVYVETQQPEKLAQAIATGFSQPLSVGLAARERVLQEFPMEKRLAGLNNVVNLAMFSISKNHR